MTGKLSVAVLLLSATAEAGFGATFLVTNTNDSGPGSLRQAMLDAIASPEDDAIHFSIGSGRQTIAPSSPLPVFSDFSVTTLDATTQPGYAGQPLIELNGANAGPLANGLAASQAALTIRGLVINRFSGDGINIVAGGGTIQGNYIGTNIDGTAALSNLRHGIILLDCALSLIGGPASPPGTFPGNVISGNGQDGVQLYDFSGNNTSSHTVQGNLVGTDSAGSLPLGNTRYGVFIAGTVGNLIGGTGPNEGNVISGNGTGIRIGGLELQATFLNRIEGNFIGTNPSGASIGNTGHGVLIATPIAGNRAFDNTIGGSAGAANTIAFNGSDGVAVTSGGTGNSIRQNRVFSNGGLGIDLGDDGATPNDPSDPDTGPNLLQNFPTLTSVLLVGGGTTVQGTLNSTPSTTFAIELFSSIACDPSGFGEGETFIGSTSGTTDGIGNAALSASLGAVSVGSVITATATDPTGNTSEFSSCMAVGLPTPSPTQTPVPSPTPTSTIAPPAPSDIPTLSIGGLVLLGLFLAIAGLLLMRTAP